MLELPKLILITFIIVMVEFVPPPQMDLVIAIDVYAPHWLWWWVVDDVAWLVSPIIAFPRRTVEVNKTQAVKMERAKCAFIGFTVVD